MKVECLHGYFRFSELSAGELSKFASLFGFTLARNGDHFTFEDLVGAPRHSIAGGTFLGAATSETFEGEPWDVMRENRLVYNFQTGEIVSLDSIDQPVAISEAGGYFVAPGMILPGSVIDDGSRVTDYAAFHLGQKNFRYSEVEYE